MSYIEAVILGLVQGLAEFLPISSSGHLALCQHFFGIDADKVLIFTVMLHTGTLISVFIIYWPDIRALIVEFFRTLKDIFTGKGLNINANPTRRLGFLIIAATIPTAVIGVLFNDRFESLYSSLIGIGIGLIISGSILFIAERLGGGDKKIMKMSFKKAFIIGCCQGIAIAPGVSRSGSTLFGGLISDLDRRFAVKFAFLVSIPSIMGSAVFEIPKAIEEGLSGSFSPQLFAGMAVAAISGVFAIKTMIRVVSNKKLIVFSLYTWLLGAAVIAYGILA